jgi:hypothetical protein
MGDSLDIDPEEKYGEVGLAGTPSATNQPTSDEATEENRTYADRLRELADLLDDLPAVVVASNPQPMGNSVYLHARNLEHWVELTRALGGHTTGDHRGGVPKVFLRAGYWTVEVLASGFDVRPNAIEIDYHRPADG